MKKHLFPLVFLITALIGHLPATAQISQDSLARVIHTSHDQQSRLRAMAVLAGELIPDYMDSARVLLEKSQELVYMTDFPEGQATWLNLSGNYNWFTGQRDSSMVNYRKTLEIESEDILKWHAAAAINLGTLHNQRGEADSTRYYLDMATEQFRVLGDEAGLAHVHSTLSVFYAQRNNYELALRYRLESMSYYESVHDTFALVHASNSIGNIYRHLNNHQKAIDFYQWGLELSRDFPHRGIVGSIYNNLTALYLTDLFDHDKLVSYAEKGIEAAKSADDHDLLFALYTNLGTGYRLIGDLDQSQRHFNQSLEYLRPITNRFYVLGAKVERARLYLDKRQLGTARQLLTEAVEMGSEMGALSWEQNAHMGLFRLDSLQGNYLSAIGHMQKANQLRDSIWQKERSDRLAELDIIYETEKREAERILLLETGQLKDQIISNQQRIVYLATAAAGLFIILFISLFISLRRIKHKNTRLQELHKLIVKSQLDIAHKNELLNGQAEELVALNQTKDKFISIIAHDLKGPFSALIGLLDILSNEFHTMNDDQKHQIINTLNKTSQNTYDLLVNLLEWSNVQKQQIENQPQHIRVREKAEEALSMLDLNIKNKKHVVANHIPEQLMAYTDPQLLNSVFINLINNAIKFTPAGGNITLSGRTSGNQLMVCIGDNGIGIPQAHINQLFDLGQSYKRSGTEKEMGTGLGLIIVKEFINIMGGDIHIKSEEGKGSEFCFSLPLGSNS